MEALFKSLKEKKIICLPIYKIDGMVVNSRLYTEFNWGNEYFYFEAVLQDGATYLDSGSTYDEFCIVINGIKDMKFNLLIGKFTNPNNLIRNNEHIPEVLPMFHHPNIEMDYQECSVCYEYTHTKTQCKHTLCLRCEQKLTTMVCPICRMSILYNLD